MRDAIEVKTRSTIARNRTFWADDFLVKAYRTADGEMQYAAMGRDAMTGKYTEILVRGDFDEVNAVTDVFRKKLAAEKLSARGGYLHPFGHY
mgnify:CR=1 FL=1